MTESKQGQNRVVVYPDWCKGCGICVAFCPKQVLALGPDGKAAVVREEACVNCGFCEPHCPDFAILVAPRNGNGCNGRKPAAGAGPAPETGATPNDDKEGRP